MSFTDYIYAIIGGLKTGLQAGLNAFIDEKKNIEMEYSKQAFSKGRQRIKPEAFLELFQTVVQEFYRRAELDSWQGYHLFGIDGSRLNLPCTAKLKEIYGSQITHGEEQVQALVSCLYDLMNGIIVDTRFSPCKANERSDAKDMILSFDTGMISNPLFIMDRGYPSAELIQAIDQAQYKYVMRCSTEFLHAMKLPKDDNIIDHRFWKMKETIKLRVVKVQLSDGETEYLATNLFDSDITLDDFKWIYRQRWGIETKYNDIKNKLEIENFTGNLPDAIMQDFYATMLLANLAGVLEYDLRDQIAEAHSNPENKYQYKQNVRMTISELKGSVVEMLSAKRESKRHRLLRKITKRLIQAVVPVRPDRSVPRKKRHGSQKFPANNKHI